MNSSAPCMPLPRAIPDAPSSSRPSAALEKSADRAPASSRASRWARCREAALRRTSRWRSSSWPNTTCHMIQNDQRIEFHKECAGGVDAVVAAYKSLSACMGQDPGGQGPGRKRVREPQHP